jgi:NADH-quinone oxidoreductase subunit G
VEYDYESQKENIEEAIKGLKETDSIVFSADITNEEALVLQSLKEKHGKSLICPDAKAYQDFLKAYGSSSGYHIFRGDLDILAASEVVISFGVWFQDESAESTALIRKALEEKKPKFVYMHPIEDATLQTNITQFIKYEVGSEEGVAALLAYALLEDKELPKDIEDILEELDIGYLSAESNVGEEELESMYSLMSGKTTTSLIIGSDVYMHPKAGQIAKLIALLEQYTGVNVLCLPPAKNALGIAMICQLDDMAQGRSIIYKSCKEGTYVNVDRCVSLNDGMQPSNVDGLHNIANALGLHAENLLDYSNQLPQDKGFQILSDDDLTKFCLYRLEPQEQERDFTLDEIDDLPVYDGAVIYTYKVENPIAKEKEIQDVLRGSKQFAMATKLQDRDLISFKVEGVEFKRVFKIDTYMKGVIALNPTFDIDLSASLLSSYRFSRLAFEKINNQKIGNNDE